MSARSHELVWAAALLECLPQVDLNGFAVESRPLSVVDRVAQSSTWVPGITLLITATRWAGAELLAEALALVEGDSTDADDGCGLVEFRHWSGWVAEASHEAAVWVEVSAGERVWQAVA